MSNTKQQIEEILDKKNGIRDRLNKLDHFDSEYNRLLLDLEEDIDRLVTKTRIAEVENCTMFTSDPIVSKQLLRKVLRNRIAELQSQLTNKEEK